jgi:hypothetical protein
MERSMRVKGAGVMALDAFVKFKHPDRYPEWIETLSPPAKEVFTHSILASDFYPMYEILIEPTGKVCDLFYGGDERGAWETGKFSASYALKGVYKIFFKLGSPKFIIDRASRVFNTYYSDGELRVAESSSGRCVLRVVKFPEPYRFIELNIGGWAEGTLELLGCKNVKVEITRSMSKGDAVSEFKAAWE